MNCRSSVGDVLKRRFQTVFAVVLSAGLLLVCVPAHGLEPAGTAVPAASLSSGPGNCTIVAGLAQPPDRVLALGRKETYKPASDKKLFRPMTEKEMRRMIYAMEPVRLKKTVGWAARAVAERMEVDFDRMGVLLNDAILLLGVLQTTEALDRLGKVPGMGEKDMAWMGQAYKAMELCAEGRYIDFGGEPAFEESLRIVESLRGLLEPLILNSLKHDTLYFLGGTDESPFCGGDSYPCAPGAGGIR